jgi:hypothetical protein
MQFCNVVECEWDEWDEKFFNFDVILMFRFKFRGCKDDQGERGLGEKNSKAF